MKLTILGATGSIGASTADVMLRHPDKFEAYALVGHRNSQRMLHLAESLRPDLVVMTDEAAAAELVGKLPRGVRLEVGMDAAVAAASASDVDMVMAAMVGSAGLPAALAAVHAGKRVGLANKECLVTAGRIFMAAAKASGADVVPVDSEHAAVHQALIGHDHASVTRIILTASGGPFRDRDPASLKDVTPEEAIAHPNWDMGAKISVDSATMMNKGLELIEAYHLFPVEEAEIDILVHPQSVIHSMVDYVDGSVLAQLGTPDMRTPIAFALAWPERMKTPAPQLSLSDIRTLTFEEPDPSRFPALRLARDALKAGNGAPTVLNAANEVAVARFLNHEITFPMIAETVERTLETMGNRTISSLDEIADVDLEARAQARTY